MILIGKGALLSWTDCRAAVLVILSLSFVAGDLAAEQSGMGIRTTICESMAGERQHCAADTSAGIAMVRSTGSTTCLLGRNWGYDATGVWVTDGCGGEFFVGSASAVASVAAPAKIELPVEELAPPQVTQEQALVGEPSESAYGTWGVLDPGKGYLLGRSDAGEVSLSAYALLRYMNQNGEDTFTDHLGAENPVDLRNDIYSHRVLVYLKGWMGLPKLNYAIAWWTVNETDQDALFANIYYQFSKRFNLFAGINGNPGSRSLQGSHPYWLGHDRVMADEFFRPFFAQGIWANGEIVPGLWYSAMLGNTSSTLGVRANQIDRKFTRGASMWWMPSTHEFGPRGAYGDWEYHERVATRFGFSTTFSPEERYTPVGQDPGNTALKLADSLNLFSTGSLAPGVTVTDADYMIYSVDAGVKYRGFFLQTEFYKRTLDGFKSDGVLPVSEIEDWGFYVQSSFFPIPRKLELYAATSQIFGDSDGGFGDASEYLVGMNFYPATTRNHRLNLQVMNVDKSPVNSTFGYYTGGQDGWTVSTAFSIYF